jgi:predicted aldo/keto reductase-like oxidoreductase
MHVSGSRRDISRRNLLKLGAAVGALGVTGGAGRVRGAESASGTNEGAPGAEDAALPQVPRRVLGRTGESIPILLMGGAMPLDRRFDPKLAEALRFGVNYYDAADCYTNGTCEVAVGNFHTKADVRKDIWITSKSDKHDPEGMEQTLLAGLEKLQTDWVDMYFLHALKDPDFLSDDLRRAVERLRTEGKLKHFGFSCHDGTVVELLHRAAATPWIDAVMFRYNFRQYGDKALNDAIDACVKANVGLIAMKTQGSAASFEKEWKAFEGSGKWTKHQAVLKAVWADDRITAAVSHMDTFEKLKQNVAAALDRTELGRLDREAIETYAAATRAHACDGCDHLCRAALSAPVPIGTVMRHLTYHDVYGETEKAKELFAKLPEEARRLGGVDFAPAAAACPHGVDVAAYMERADRVLRA